MSWLSIIMLMLVVDTIVSIRSNVVAPLVGCMLPALFTQV